MTDNPGALPQRIGDRERDQAVEFLREHMAEGRIDSDEFEERLTGALTAKTQADLEPLFQDLPSPKPGVPAVGFLQPGMVKDISVRPPYPVRLHSRPSTALAVASALIWPAMIMLIIASNGQLLFFMFLPFLLPWIIGQGHRRPQQRR